MPIASEKTQRIPFLRILENQGSFLSSQGSMPCLIPKLYFFFFEFTAKTSRTPKTGGMVVSTIDELFLDLNCSITS